MAAITAIFSLRTPDGLIVGTARALDSTGVRFDVRGTVPSGVDLEWKMELPGTGETVRGWLSATEDGVAPDDVPRYRGRIVRVAAADEALFGKWRTAVLEGRAASVYFGRTDAVDSFLGGMRGTTQAERAWAVAQMDARRNQRQARAIEVLGAGRGEARRDADREVTVPIPVKLPERFRVDPLTVPVPVPTSVRAGRPEVDVDEVTRPVPVSGRLPPQEPVTRRAAVPLPAPYAPYGTSVPRSAPAVSGFGPAPRASSPVSPPPPPVPSPPAVGGPRVATHRVSGALFVEVTWSDPERAQRDLFARMHQAMLRVPGRMDAVAGDRARISLMRPGVPPLRVTGKVERLGDGADGENLLMLPIDELRRWAEL